MLKKIGVSFVGCVMCLCMAACGGLEDKSIMDPLSLEQRQELISKDFNYALVFGLIDAVEERKPQFTSSEKKSYKDLSYRRLNEFLKKWTDTEFVKERHAKYEKEWMDVFNSYIPKVDSISEYWLDFLDAYRPENYLKIELTEITDKSDVFLGYVKVILRLTPLKGSVSNVDVFFGLDGSMMDRNSVSYENSFSSPVSGSTWMNFNYVYDIDASKVNELSIDELLKEYPLKSRIVSLKVDGKPIDYAEGYFQVPDCIRTLWQKLPGKGKEWKSDYDRINCYERVIKEMIDTTMMSEVSYVSDNFQRDAFEYDDLAANFYYVTAR